MFKNNRDFRLSSLESDSEYMECILEICIFLISSPSALVSWPYLENTGQTCIQDVHITLCPVLKGLKGFVG